MKKLTIAIAALASGIVLCTPAWAGGPIAPLAPYSPNADQMAANWSKMFKKHLTKGDVLKLTCGAFPSEAQVGVKAYPDSLAVDMGRGGGSVADSEDVPMVELVTKDSLRKVAAWYKTHYPKMRAKYEFETAGPGLNYETRDNAQYKHQPAGLDVTLESGQFGGCGGLLEAPDAYRTGVRIYYRPHGK